MTPQERLRRTMPWLTDEQINQHITKASAQALTPYQKAFMDTIAGPESAGRYNVIYGGSQFNDYSRHPGKYVPITSGPNKGKTSSAAGKYQFLESTWKDQAKKLGLQDFSPQSQDLAAWNLAKENYKGNLDAVLQSGDLNAITNAGQSLRGIWTSLPGGIEQGTNVNKFASAYQKNLSQPMAPYQAAAIPSYSMPTGVQGTAQGPSAVSPTSSNPFGGLMSAMMMQKMAQPNVPEKTIVNGDATMPENPMPVNPEEQLAIVSHTPNAYFKKRRGIRINV